MKNLSTLTFHPTAEKIVDILCKKTQNANPMFFRVLVSYYLTKITAMMRVKIATRDRGEVPVNLYAINLAASGQGKGFSTNIIEEQIINQFKDVFFDQTYPVVVDQNLAKLAVKRAYISGDDPDVVRQAVQSEFNSLGKLAFSFDSGTTAAVKQMRHQLLMADIGSMNLEIDEIGSNLLGNMDVLGTFLELFDVGKVKQKLTKNTKENIRSEEIDGKTPTNLLLFGTPIKLFDGAKVEDEFWSFVATGYGRRCLFGYTRQSTRNKTMTPEQIYDSLTDPSVDKFLSDMSLRFGKLANILNYNKKIAVSKKVSILLIEYRQHGENLADQLGEHEEIAKAEFAHRYFKALKLAGTYAFIDGASEITDTNLYAAIKMVEESGKAFTRILNRDRNYVKLAKYISSINREVTHVDLTEDLPFYRGSNTAKHDLMQLAIAWGYKNHVVIKRKESNGIEFISGETLKKTDLSHMHLAYSDNIAVDYKNVQARFDKLYILMQKDYKHWVNHHMINGHRTEENMLPGFDMLVLDVDSGMPVKTIKLLMQDYTFLLYTTKRHTQEKNRFRMILPINYHLKLSATEYKIFMEQIFKWLPFDVDTQTSQRSRKWLTHNSHYEYNKGKYLLDARLFIPKTTKNDEQKRLIQTHQSLTNLERWFIQHSKSGNRNNQLIKYAFMLVDMDYPIDQIETQIESLNKKFSNRLSDIELQNTIIKSTARAVVRRDAKK